MYFLIGLGILILVLCIGTIVAGKKTTGEEIGEFFLDEPGMIVFFISLMVATVVVWPALPLVLVFWLLFKLGSKFRKESK